MLNETLGQLGMFVPAGRPGCAIYGPYEQVAPGHFRITFLIIPATAAIEGDPIIAMVDVVGNYGNRFYAADFVRLSELGPEGQVSLDVFVPEDALLEYRAHSTGVGSLFFVDRPKVVAIDPTQFRPGRLSRPDGDEIVAQALEVGQRLEDLLQAAGAPPAMDEALLGRELRAALSLLRPHGVIGLTKERIGSTRDGGYVCVLDFDGVDVVLSLGISDNVDFDEDVAARGMTVYQYDHTVDDPRPDDARMVFHKQMISVRSSPASETLPNLIRRHDTGGSRPNIFLKIDIENWEWSVFDDIEVAALSRVRQITGEFHAFEFFRFPAWRNRMRRVLDKLAQHFVLIHVHANNYAGTTLIDGVTLPNVLELTFVNRSCYEVEPSNETFPTSLDMACDAGRPDYQLDQFVFA